MQFVINNWYLFAGLAVVSVLLAGPTLSRLMHGVRNVGASQAVGLINRQSGVLVDVREPAEYGNGRIPEAILLPLSRFQERLTELEKFKNRPVVLYCRSGQRSGRAAVLLRKRGFASVHNLAGGIQAWQGENLPVEK
ncbi:MAG: rhodanese-like domain-containing protein [Gammaproteobacteria bacterium]|nr:rhodanese-like domain-containing protein [Gammaproteobacteria bacterium]